MSAPRRLTGSLASHSESGDDDDAPTRIPALQDRLMRRATLPACLLALAGANAGEVLIGDDTLFGGVEVLIVACAALLLGTLATAAVAAWAVLGQAIGGALGAIAPAPGALTVAATLVAATVLHRLHRRTAGAAADPTATAATAPRSTAEAPGQEPRAAIPTGDVLRAHGLTARECEVAGLALWGFTAEAIGRRLFIGRRTVETHLSHVYSKLGVHSRAELVETVFAMARQAELPEAQPEGPERIGAVAGTSPRARSRSAVSGGPRWKP